MTKMRTLLLAAACTVTGAGGALGVTAISSVANGDGHSSRADHAFNHHLHHGWGGLGRAVHAEAVVPASDDTFKTVTFDRGTVKSVSGDQLTITEGTKDATYKDVVVTVPSDAKVRRGHDTAALSDLQAGDRVAVFQSPKRTVVLAAPVHAESTRHKRGH